MKDQDYMKIALELAKKGIGHTNPNPMVGSIIVKNNKIIGKGYHEQYGQLHAERNALKSVTESPIDAVMYVTLEPCCHYGKTPPCTEAIIKSGIKKVVIASTDPNPLVAGKGITQLKENGIEIITGILQKEALELNHVFYHYIQHKSPYVVMKYAMTADGKIATYNGASKWITGSAARNHVHHLRNQYTSIMAGIQTVLIDDPLLTCRISNGRNPIRIICDTHLRIPFTSKIVKTANDIKTIIAYHNDSLFHKKELEYLGVNFIQVPLSENGHLDLSSLMKELERQNIDSILLEGGSTLNESFLKENLVNALKVYIAPKLFGGTNAPSPIGGLGVKTPDNSYLFQLEHVKTLEEDILLEYSKQEVTHVYRNN